MVRPYFVRKKPNDLAGFIDPVVVIALFKDSVWAPAIACFERFVFGSC